MVSQNLRNLIDEHEYISFDIFDTLIKRSVIRPEHVFAMVENETPKFKGFLKKRKFAEKIANHILPDGKASIDDIYKYVWGYSKETKECLKQRELDVETNIIFCNQEIKEIYDYCIENKKKVILTSDMYLSSDQIKILLDKCGYNGYIKIYVSNEQKVSKGSGKIFKMILDELNINGNQLVHIGDNYNSDYKMPKSLNINAYYYEIKKEKYGIIQNVYTSMFKELYSIRHQAVSNEYFEWGYTKLGPALYILADWIKSEIEKEENNIVFLAREGLILKDAVNILNKKKYKYMYASRRSLTSPAFSKMKGVGNWEGLIQNMPIGKKTKVKYVLEMLGEDFETYQGMIEKYADKNTYVNKQNYENVYTLIEDELEEYSDEQNKAFMKYLKNNNMDEINSIFDLSGNGTLQFRLQQILNKNLAGYYFYVTTRNFYGLQNRKGFLNIYLPDYIKLFERYSCGLMETLFMPQHGTTLKYSLIDGEPILLETEYCREVLQELEDIQSGALQFVSDFVESGIGQKICITKRDYMYEFVNALINPSEHDIKLLSGLGSASTYGSELFPVHEKDYYKRHAGEFLRDFLNSSWRAGFLSHYLRFNPLKYKI